MHLNMMKISDNHTTDDDQLLERVASDGSFPLGNLSSIPHLLVLSLDLGLGKFDLCGYPFGWSCLGLAKISSTIDHHNIVNTFECLYPFHLTPSHADNIYSPSSFIGHFNFEFLYSCTNRVS